MSLLEDIVKCKERELKRAAVPLRELKARVKNAPPPRPFHQVFRPDDIGLIAEIKRHSPARGELAPNLDVAATVKAYERGGASALSVLTDRTFFHGSFDDLKTARTGSKLPILRKDFIIDEYQIWESRTMLADAILLIARILDRSQLRDYIALGQELGLAALVEVHGQKDLEAALDAGPRIVGINNRDLETFQVNLQTCLRLRPMIPPGIVAVAESGIRTREDVSILKKAGFQGILVGEELVTSPDPEAKVRELLARPAAAEPKQEKSILDLRSWEE